MPSAATIRAGYGNLQNNFNTDLQNFNVQGADYNYLRRALKNIIGGTDSAYRGIRNTYGDVIGRATQRNIRQTNQNLAATGLNRAGIGQAARNDIYANEANSLGELEARMNQYQLGRSDNALRSLLGLNESQAGRAMQYLFGKNDFLRQLLQGQNRDLFSRESMDLQSKNADRAFWGDIIGGLLSGGSNIIASE